MENKEKILNEVNDLYVDIDMCIQRLTDARLNKEPEEEKRALFEMESLMVQSQQTLGVIEDYLKGNEDKLKEKVDIWLRTHLPRVIDEVYYPGVVVYKDVLNEDMRQMMWEDLK